MENQNTASPSVEPEQSMAPGVAHNTRVKPEIVYDASLSDYPEVEESADSPGSDEPANIETNHLERLCVSTSLDALDALEKGVGVASYFLDQLHDALSACETRDTDHWIDAITDLQKRATPARTVVGVVGNTGAGKSSVINALLDEEKLLPTNCLRACTASPSEISFNHSDDPRELYRAEIEFISPQEWARELQILFSDLLDGNGQVSREATKTDTEAGIAYAKVRAVYPQKTREMLAQADPEELAREPAVRGILGTTKVLGEETAEQLYHKMQHYVDSREKSTGSVAQRKKENIPMEYWPLIRVVRIYTKANALSTGAVIVDLPGVQDSNPARAAVAANYMKSCTGLWIVAPITRAVDDKTAKSLLGDHFKRQLKYDGTYSAVTFICSKTDDISITEAAESLGLEDQFEEFWSTAQAMDETMESCKAKISELRVAKSRLEDNFNNCELETEKWEDLQDQHSAGKTVYTPSTNPKKRARGQGHTSGPEGSRLAGDGDESRKPLTDKQIEDKISSLREERKAIRKNRRTIDAQIAELRQESKVARDEREMTTARFKAICIQGRNQYSKGAIQQDFAMGIKELDHENSAEHDEATFDPEQDVRDYDKMARSLPVFCVSSRAYQKLTGKLEKDDFRSDGFLSTDDTEIPGLQTHAKKLTEAGRSRHCRRFLNDLFSLVNSVKLWSKDDGNGIELTDEEKQKELLYLQKLLDHLDEGLETATKQVIDDLRATFQEQIFDRISTSMPSAIDDACTTAYSWGAPRSQGGLFWSTYKATVRRSGVYSGACGPRDFNQDLFDPISRNLAPGWERAFQNRIPSLLKTFADTVVVTMKEFHEAAKSRAERNGTNLTSLATLSSGFLAVARELQEIPTTFSDSITEKQRAANREFTPAILNAMNRAYVYCTDEHGTGSYARMKAMMMDHVETVRNSMFDDATEAVRKHLDDMCDSLKNDFELIMRANFRKLSEEYMRILIGFNPSGQPWNKSRSPDAMDRQSRVYKVLLRGDLSFAPALELLGEPASAESAVSSHADDANDVDDFDELIQADIREQGESEDSH
ncbi:hypothetical protein F4808DRAFT_470663 [Astrocystis sublimbata]|nr:hypothetical protein F4808DRAFT_470663 [Astrocystis sublimbata]